MNCTLWIPLRCFKKSISLSFPCGQMNVSSTYLYQQAGLCVYSQQQIRAIKPATRTNKIEDKPTCTAYLPYTQTTYGRLSKMLAKYNIKSVAIPPRKTSSYIPPAKDAPGLTPGIYGIPCECGKVYIGKSGRSIQLRIKEHGTHQAVSTWQISGGRTQFQSGHHQTTGHQTPLHQNRLHGSSHQRSHRNRNAS